MSNPTAFHENENETPWWKEKKFIVSSIFLFIILIMNVLLLAASIGNSSNVSSIQEMIIEHDCLFRAVATWTQEQSDMCTM